MTQVSVLRIGDLNAVGFIENRVVRFCAAHVINILERWTKWKLKRQQDLWIYMPIIRQEVEPKPEGKNPTSWHQELLGQFGKDAIRSALAILEQIGVVSRRKNPYNGQDKTYQYLLVAETLKELKEAPTSEGDISPMGGDCSMTTQRSTLSSTKLERCAPKANFSESEQKELGSIPSTSNIQTESVSDPKVIAQDHRSAAPVLPDFENLKKADLTQFEPPDNDRSIEGEFFEWVVAHRVLKLPIRPADPEVVAKNWIRKNGKIALRAFMRWKNSLLDRPSLPPLPTAAECQATAPEPRSPEQILENYQQMWERSPNMRRSILQMIQKCPEWGIAIGEEGPCWKEDLCQH